MTQINKSHAFTIVELVVVAPIVILVIGTFILAAVTMTGDVMATRASNLLAFNIQDTLNRIQNEAKVSNGINTSIYPPYAPQDSDGITGAVNGGSALAFSVYGMPADPTISIDKVGTYRPTYSFDGLSCSETGEIYPPDIFNIVYFKKSDNSLWRRVTGANYCNNYPDWPKPSCPSNMLSQGTQAVPGRFWTSTASFNVCQATDMKLIDGVDNFSIQYNPDHTSATVTITAKQTIAGREITQSGTVTAYSAK